VNLWPLQKYFPISHTVSANWLVVRAVLHKSGDQAIGWDYYLENDQYTMASK